MAILRHEHLLVIAKMWILYLDLSLLLAILIMLRVSLTRRVLVFIIVLFQILLAIFILISIIVAITNISTTFLFLVYGNYGNAAQRSCCLS
jgi:hypothetical protein